MKKEIIQTADGSHTVSIPEMNVTYHSVHGAIRESMHVFIEAGLNYVLERWGRAHTLRIFEMGFGTGLNAFLTAIKAVERATDIHYTTVETSPLSIEQAGALNYAAALGHAEHFHQLHRTNWNEATAISAYFTLKNGDPACLNLRPAKSSTLFISMPLLHRRSRSFGRKKFLKTKFIVTARRHVGYLLL